MTDATANYQALSLHNLEKLDAGSWMSVVMLDPFTADYATVTATVELVKDMVVIASLTKTYTTDYTDSVAENSDYSYKIFPKGKGAYDAYMVQPSPILHGVYTTVDDATGQLKLYAYGRGVYVLSADGETDFVAWPFSPTRSSTPPCCPSATSTRWDRLTPPAPPKSSAPK